MGLPGSEESLTIQYINLTDRHTDRHVPTAIAAHIALASGGKMSVYSKYVSVYDFRCISISSFVSKVFELYS